MFVFNQQDKEKIEAKLVTLKSRYIKLLTKIFAISERTTNEKTKEYLIHGVSRRLSIIERCIENIYSIFPLDRNTLLCDNELHDININLHAFFVNIFGLLDNLAWAFIYEKQAGNKINRNRVGLYEKQTQEYIEKDFRDYLNSERIKNWHKEYLKNYRDALSHRIPLYVPPKTLNPEQRSQMENTYIDLNNSFKSCDLSSIAKLQKKEKEIGDPCPFFTHSFSEAENKYMILHAQVITDFKTIEVILEKFCETFNPKKDNTWKNLHPQNTTNEEGSI